MSNKNPNSIASKGEGDPIEALVSALKRVEEKIETAIDAKTSFETIIEYEKSYRAVAEKINALDTKLEISDKIKEEYKADITRATKRFAYREKRDESEAIAGKDPISQDSNASLLEAHIQKTPVISGQNKGEIPTLNFD